MLSSLKLDGSVDSLLIFPQGNLIAEGASSFSMEAWICTTTMGRRMQILSFGSEAALFQSAWLFVEEAGRLAFDLNGFSGPRSDIKVSDGIWHHTAVVVNQGNVQLYVDGKATGPLQHCSPSIRAGEAWIGAAFLWRNTPEFSQWRFVGRLSEVRVWSIALSAAEVAKYAINRPLSSTAGLAGYWPLNTNQDVSLGKHPLSILGNPSPEFTPSVGPQEVPESLVPTSMLSADFQNAFKANPTIFLNSAARFDAMQLAQEHRDAIAQLTPAQWQQICAGLSASSDFQSLVAAEGAPATPKPPVNLEAPRQKTDEQTQRILQGLGIACGAVFGVASTIAGIAAAALAAAGPTMGLSAAIAAIAAGYASLFGLIGGTLFGIMSMIDPLISTLEKGGQGGTIFNDEVPAGARLMSITLAGGAVIDSIQCRWQLPNGTIKEGERHGGSGGSLYPPIVLAKDEVITQVSGRCGTRVDSLTFTTNYRKYGPYGGGGGSDFVLTPVTGWVVGFSGRSGGVLDAIGIQDFRYLYERSYQGGSGGIPFIDDMSNMKRLERILYRSGSYVDTLQFEWLEQDGTYVTGPEYGGYLGAGGEKGIVTLQDGEYLLKITGTAGAYLDSITFHTNLGTYGPFGGSGGTPFSIDLRNRKLIGIIGRYGKYIDGIGALTKKLEAKDILERLANVPALKLNGVADYLSVDQALIPPVGNFTVSVTFKADAFGPDNGELVSQIGQIPFYLGRGWSGYIRASDEWENTGVGFPNDGRWHNLTLVRDSAATILYMDGAPRARKESAITPPNGSVFRIGRQYGGYGEYFGGAIAEIAVWSEARTADEVRTSALWSLDGNEPGLCAMFRFDQPDPLRERCRGSLLMLHGGTLTRV